MTTTKKGARKRLSLVQLATELSNVSQTCRLMRYTQQQLYSTRSAKTIRSTEPKDC